LSSRFDVSDPIPWFACLRPSTPLDILLPGSEIDPSARVALTRASLAEDAKTGTVGWLLGSLECMSASQAEFSAVGKGKRKAAK
jgi:hypothetical protein